MPRSLKEKKLKNRAKNIKRIKPLSSFTRIFKRIEGSGVTFCSLSVPGGVYESWSRTFYKGM